ncbi:MAG: hypothetical protein JKX85_09265 [Phycisphaeraceae bacterium]|nr:hypothetical protein [Phycisphaeraceae bacterium]
MDIKVHCPKATCRATLTVPLTAAGHVARCPLCHETFLIPTQDDIAEQTVSSWLEDDIEDLEDQTDQKWQKTLEEEATCKAHEEELKREETAKEIEKIMAGNQQFIDALKTTSTDPDDPAATTALPITANIVAPTGPTDPTATKSPRPEVPVPDPVSDPADTTISTDTPAAPAQAPSANHETIAAKPVQSPRKSHQDKYPSELDMHVPRPYLLVTQCTQSGVILSFDSRFLEHEGFRLSMPIACAFTGEKDPSLLIAKPMAFLDQPCGEIHNAYEVEAGHEAKPSQKQTPKEMLARMGIIEQFKKPFRLPMPYYMRTDHSSQSLKCTTTSTGDGPTIAHVHIPDGLVAIRWLRHVNGICGPEFDLLQKDVSHLWHSKWTHLDEAVRRRIEVWAHFRDGEQFRYFISDADMLKKDDGLAGVVLTDRRLIYKKFHRQGQVEFGTNAQLIIRPDGTMAGLRVKTQEGTFKCAKFHFKDLQKLKDAATDLGFGLDIAR